MEVRKASIPDRNVTRMKIKIDNDYVFKTTQPILMILLSFFSEDNVSSDEIKIC